MAARRESGTPAAHTVLEVADGLRWTDPALGVSLAEHARRLAGDDDPVTRAAAERSILRSLTEADRYDEVVHRAGPLLDEARQRGDRDDAAAVVVELASAVMGLGDGPTAWTMVDRLQPVDDLPARVAAAAALVRTRVRAEGGDVVGTDGEAELAAALLLRVPEPEAGLLRRELACARGRARRRARDLPGALAVLASTGTAHPDDDPDGGRRSLAAAAEQLEVLVELGRGDEARARASELLSRGPVAPALLRAASRIRLVLAEAGGGDTAETRAAAQALEDAGHLDDAARAWQVVAASAENRGDLGEALAALRHGHTLESRARDEHGRSLRRVAAVDVGDLRALPRTSMPPAPVPPAPEAAPPAVELPPDEQVLETLPRRRGHHRDEESPAEVAPARPDPFAATERESVSSARVGDHGAGLGRQDELADLLAALSRSMEQLPGPASRADDVRPSPADAAPIDPGRRESRPDEADRAGHTPTDDDPLVTATPRAGSRRGRSDTGEERVPAGGRRSRHSAAGAASDGDRPDAGLSPATRPTFDAFSTAPLSRPEPPAAAPTPEPHVSERRTPEWPVSDLWPPDPLSADPASAEPRSADPLSAEPLSTVSPSLEFPSLEPTRPESTRPESTRPESTGPGPVAPEPATPEPSASDRAPREQATPEWSTSGSMSREAPTPTDVASEPADRFAPYPDAPVRERSDGTPYGVASVSVPDTPSAPSVRAGDPSPVGDGSSSTARGGNAFGPPPTSAPGEGRPQEEPAPSRASAPARPAPREESSRPERETRPTNGRAASREAAEGSAPRGQNPTSSRDELQEDLGLTLASVLGEYDLPDVPMPPRTDRPRSSANVAVPSARRHTSGSMPVPAEGRRDARDGGGEPPAPSAPRPSGGSGRPRPQESGPRLADLLAEAMDAFRHAGPAAQDDARPPGVGSRRA